MLHGVVVGQSFSPPGFAHKVVSGRNSLHRSQRSTARTSPKRRSPKLEGRSSPSTGPLVEPLPDGRYCGGRVLYLCHQPRIPFVLQPYHDRFLRVAHVPEHALVLPVEGARRDDPQHVGSAAPDTQPPSPHRLGVGLGARHVGQRWISGGAYLPRLGARGTLRHEPLRLRGQRGQTSPQTPRPRGGARAAGGPTGQGTPSYAGRVCLCPTAPDPEGAEADARSVAWAASPRSAPLTICAAIRSPAHRRAGATTRRSVAAGTAWAIRAPATTPTAPTSPAAVPSANSTEP